MHTFWYDLLTSTNDMALERAGELDNLSIIAAFCQSAGRGQAGNKWSSREGENLLFSILLKDFRCFGLDPLPAGDQFLLSRAAALAVVTFLEKWDLQAAIKWPNDIYVGDRKIAGILIENALRGQTLVRSIVGVGLNLGQREFPPELPNPTSVSLQCGADFSKDDLVRELERFAAIFEAKLQEEAADIGAEYERRLYRRMEWHPYRDMRSGKIFEARLLGTDRGGLARLEDRSGAIRKYAFKELAFVI